MGQLADRICACLAIFKPGIVAGSNQNVASRTYACLEKWSRSLLLTFPHFMDNASQFQSDPQIRRMIVLLNLSVRNCLTDNKTLSLFWGIEWNLWAANIPIEEIARSTIPHTTYWNFKTPTIPFDLHEIRDKHSSYSTIYTEGSKNGDRVASVACIILFSRLPDKSSVISVEIKNRIQEKVDTFFWFAFLPSGETKPEGDANNLSSIHLAYIIYRLSAQLITPSTLQMLGVTQYQWYYCVKAYRVILFATL